MTKAYTMLNNMEKKYPELMIEMDYNKVSESGTLTVSLRSKLAVSKKYEFFWSIIEHKFMFFELKTGDRVLKLYKDIRNLIKVME